MLTERDILVRLKDGLVTFPPLSLFVAELYPTLPRDANLLEIDALVEAAWGARRYRFAVDCKAYSNPKGLNEAIERVSSAAAALNARPLFLTLWLPPKQLDELERQQISGIDLNGNGVVIIPHELLIRRTGQPNAYPRTVPIKKVYQGRSSLIPRVFLVKPYYGSVNEVYEEIIARSGRISMLPQMQSAAGKSIERELALSTVSRVLQELEKDLIITREKRALRLLQPEKLLENLADGYKAPVVTSRFLGRSSLSVEELTRRVGLFASREGTRAVLTGAASVNRYATMAREPVVSVYSDSDAETTARRMELESTPTDRFPNVEVLQTLDDTIYFDRRADADGVYASPVQAWLELATGDKRHREVAEQIKATLLNNVLSATGQVGDK